MALIIFEDHESNIPRALRDILRKLLLPAPRWPDSGPAENLRLNVLIINRVPSTNLRIR